MDVKISVIIPCYNHAIFLNEAADSVLMQSYTNWECIIVNDGSSDNTEEVAIQISKNDERFIYIKQFNKGLSAARNAALETCSGDFIQFLDSDDALHPKKLENHIEFIKKSGFSNEDILVSYSEYYFGDHIDIYKTSQATINCRFISDNPLKEIVTNWGNLISIPANAYLFSANIFLSNGIRFDEEITTCEDIDCWIRIFQLNPHILFFEQKLAYYRNTPGSMSKNLEKVCKGHVQVMEKHMAFAGKGIPLYKWARYKRNELLFQHKKISKMDFLYMLYFGKGLIYYYCSRLITKFSSFK
jgi:glycosyltransferase involved in cell wall biosynthesis